jgi:hypothetical protein
MRFKEEILKHYLDVDKLVTIDRDPGKWSSGNSLLFTGLFYTILHKLREATPEDVERFSEAVGLCWEGSKEQAIPGLLERNDGREDREAHDDYVGVVAASFHLGTRHAGDIYAYGKAHFWSFDNVHPGVFSFQNWARNFHGRFPGLVGFYHAGVRQHPGFINNIQLASKILANAYSDKTDIDGKLMTWLMISVLEQTDYCALVGDAMDVWNKQFRKNYGTLGKMLAPYFGASHPFSRVEL